MKLLTKSIEKALLKHPLHSQKEKDEDAKVLVKYFNPCGAGTWLITEGEKLENGDWLLYGKVQILTWNWGTVLLSELENFRSWPWRMGIERDLYSKGTIKELSK